MESSTSVPVIRAARVADAAGVRAIYAPIVRDTVISFETEPPDESEMARRIRETLRRYPWLVCEAADAIQGYAYAGPHRSRHAYRWSVEVSVYVAESARGHGIGRQLYRALLDLLAAQGYCNAYGGITLPNPASVGLHEALGFRAVGVYHDVGYKDGAWHDVGWWELRLRDDPDPSENLRSFSQLEPEVDWSRWTGS